MIKSLSRLLNRVKDGDTAIQDWTPEEYHVAAAALMVEAARSDGAYSEAERALIGRVLADRLDLAEEEAARLLESGEAAQDGAVELFKFTHALKTSLDAKARIGLIEMLWEVVYADGRLDAFEDRLVRRVAGLLHVPDQDRSHARQRVLARMEAKGQAGPLKAPRPTSGPEDDTPRNGDEGA